VLLGCKAANLDRSVATLLAAARDRSTQENIPLAFALACQHAKLARAAGATKDFPHQFVCDAGLGGLARWLRGSGYQAFWKPELDDAAIIRETQRLAATLITTDTLMMERGVLRDGLVPSVFVPSTLTPEHQLEIVFRELDLTPRESRCMNCGGELCAVEKSAVADRIPPKTARWLDAYFVCAECGQLFWRGTHWQRMQERLARASQQSSTE